MRHIGLFDDEEDAARAYNAAIRRAGLEDKRRMNAVDATGALVPREYRSYRGVVVASDLSRDPTTTTSKFWGVSWNKSARRWMARTEAPPRSDTTTPRRRPRTPLTQRSGGRASKGSGTRTRSSTGDGSEDAEEAPQEPAATS